jgi:hypothetical protein
MTIREKAERLLKEMPARSCSSTTALLRITAAIERLNRALANSQLRVELGATGQPALTGGRHGLDGALASIAGIVAVAQIDGSWCSMSVCGSRAKAREYRRRRKGLQGA